MMVKKIVIKTSAIIIIFFIFLLLGIIVYPEIGKGGVVSAVKLPQRTMPLPILEQVSNATAQEGSCEPLGWFPSEFGLKDHSVFYFDGYYYLVSNYIPGEKHFAYARSMDMCTWEDLTPVFDIRTDSWESLAIWAPFVYFEDGLYYMYYTGVKGPYPYLTQSIMLATSPNPADPNSWEQKGMIFQPNHADMVWKDNAWADCRDPMVLKVDDTYYLYYTGRDKAGGIIGIATSTSPVGPWQDEGAVITIDGAPIPESPTVFENEGTYYLFYNKRGEYFRNGTSPRGPWLDEVPFQPGWAHEVWVGQDDLIYTSYLTDYSVTISRLIWDGAFSPFRPFIGTTIFHTFFPIEKR